MTSLLPEVDPEGLLEYSVVFTDRSLNHMSQTFQQVMRDISTTLKDVYNAEAVIVVPGGGTYGMESVARQFATGQKCLVIRNGFFSFRWSQIIEMGGLTDETHRSAGPAEGCRTRGAVRATRHRRSDGYDPTRKTGCRFCAARGHVLGHDPAG